MNLPEIKTRLELPTLMDQIGLKTGAELGVCRGDFSVHLLKNSRLEKLYSVDAWSADYEATRSVFKKWAIRKDELAEQEAETRRRLAEFGDRSEVRKGLTFDVADQFQNGQLDFVYVDASHRFTGVAMDLIKWWPKVRTGGIFAGHDYWRCYRYEVMEAVNGFLVEMKQVLHVTTHDKNVRGDNKYPPSWWVVKQDLTKDQWLRQIRGHMPVLLEQEKTLKAKGVKIVLPYQYYELCGMDIPEMEEE